MPFLRLPMTDKDLSRNQAWVTQLKVHHLNCMITAVVLVFPSVSVRYVYGAEVAG